MEELVNKIKEYAQKYYQGEDTISDSEFDRLIEELREKDPGHPLLTTVGWGYDISKNHKAKTKHLGEAYGISSKIYVDKSKNVRDFFNKVKTGKFDGGSVELIYYKGNLMRAITRGDGVIGIDVTHILKYIVPPELPFSYTGNFMGEFILPNENMTKEDGIAQRNIPNGFLQRIEVESEECKRFLYIPYKITKYKPDKNVFVATDRESILNFIYRCGFVSMSYYPHDSNPDITYEEMIKILSQLNEFKGKIYTVPLDGIVVQSNEIEVSDIDKDGYCTVRYKDESAYKTVNDRKEVKITGIDWNLTRLGRLVPTVLYEEVELAGAYCSRATAFHAQYIKDNKLGVGSTIEVIRSGEVIPYIYDVIESNNPEIPNKCPKCGSELKWNGVHLVCDNEECRGKSYQSVKRWIEVLGSVDNLGSSVINSLIDEFDLDSIHALYEDRMSFYSLRQIEGFGSAKIKVVVNMYKKLFEPKPVNHYLVALNIPTISYETAYKIVEGSDIEDMIFNEGIDSDYLYKQLISIKGLSSTSINNLINNISKIEEFRNYVKFIRFTDFYKSDESNDSRDRLKIYVTGKLDHFKNRNDLYSELFNKVVKESNIKECDYFVTNKSPLTTDHYKKAVENGVKIITEEELMRLVEG